MKRILIYCTSKKIWGENSINGGGGGIVCVGGGRVVNERIIMYYVAQETCNIQTSTFQCVNLTSKINYIKQFQSNKSKKKNSRRKIWGDC